MVRDPRADIIEPSPFYGTQQKIHRVHAGQQTRSTSPINNFFRVMSQTQPKLHKGGIWHFSEEEKKHLLYATAAFTLALGIAAAAGLRGLSADGFSPWILKILLSMPVMLIAVGPAFVLHEIGHKIVAKKNGCWAEFRAYPKGLQFGVLISLFFGVLFMAPGAVMVAGLVTRRQNGHIAVAGPLTNLSLFLIGIPLWGLLLGLTGAHEYLAANTREVFEREYVTEGVLNWKAMFADAAFFWLTANLILGLFNMLPFGPLDGVKVKDWNEKVFFIVLITFAILVLTMFIGTWSPNTLLSAAASPVAS